MSTISVIVPIYNAEKYLEGCIQSILNQSFTDFELILVNDGSADQCGTICDVYARKDKRVRVFHQENKGVSSARNLGLSKAEGLWIAFVDADDSVSPDYLKHLFEGLVPDTTESLLVWGSPQINSHAQKQLPKEIFYSGDAAKYIIRNRLLALSGPISKLFSRQVLNKNKIRFPINVSMGEDAIFLQRYLNATEAVSLISDVDYYVHDTGGSLSKRVYSFESEWACFTLWKKLLSEYVSKYPSQFPNPGLVIWNNRIGKTFKRCLFSVANQHPHWSLVRQWKTLRCIPRLEYKEFKQYYQAETLADWCYTTVIACRYLLLFVMIINRKSMIRTIWK